MIRKTFSLTWRLIWMGVLGLMVYIAWPPNIPSLRLKNPSKTALMQLRTKQAKAKGRTLKSTLSWKPIDQISSYLVHAVLLAEDDTFYQHHGFDFQQIRIALVRNIEKGKYVYGGSTITQQLARTLYLSPQKNMLRKAKEAALTVYLEHFLKKKRILEIYLNVVEWGPGIYGAEAAAQHYYGKSAADLTPDEAVALASILPSPRRWSPNSERAFMARRRTLLYERLQRAGYAPTYVSTDTPNTEETLDFIESPLP